MGFFKDHLQMLESSILPKFQLIQDRKTILPFKDVNLTLVPHMWVPWGTDRWDIFDLQSRSSTFLIGLELHRFCIILERVSPNLFHR